MYFFHDSQLSNDMILFVYGDSSQYCRLYVLVYRRRVHLRSISHSSKSQCIITYLSTINPARSRILTSESGSLVISLWLKPSQLCSDHDHFETPRLKRSNTRSAIQMTEKSSLEVNESFELCGVTPCPR
jgi:hypothetical protein